MDNYLAVANSRNELYALKESGQLTIVMPDGAVKPGPVVELKEKFSARWGASLALDEQKGRIYATCYRTKQYYIWYWDLKDGSFHGVLPTPEKSGKRSLAFCRVITFFV